MMRDTLQADTVLVTDVGWNKLEHHRHLPRCLSGRPGESHPRAPTERNVTVSRHSALLIHSS